MTADLTLLQGFGQLFNAHATEEKIFHAVFVKGFAIDLIFEAAIATCPTMLTVVALLAQKTWCTTDECLSATVTAHLTLTIRIIFDHEILSLAVRLK